MSIHWMSVASFRYVSFFDVPVPPPPDREGSVERPEWAGPPRGVLPAHTPQRAVIFRTDDVFLAVDRLLVYPAGLEFTLVLLMRDSNYELQDIPWELHRRPRAGELPDDFIRFGLVLADGSKWTNLDWREPWGEAEVTGPIVSGRGGGGGGDAWEMSYWLWPLPPEGEITFVASWPVHGIPESTATIDSTELRERATEAENIWPT
jgi:hypothetical protein